MNIGNLSLIDRVRGFMIGFSFNLSCAPYDVLAIWFRSTDAILRPGSEQILCHCVQFPAWICWRTFAARIAIDGWTDLATMPAFF